jgi:hypothetical protein
MGSTAPRATPRCGALLRPAHGRGEGREVAGDGGAATTKNRGCAAAHTGGENGATWGKGGGQDGDPCTACMVTPPSVANDT